MHLVAPSVNIFFINDGRVLLGRRKNTGWMDDFLCPPGGHVEKGESPQIAAVREVEEELGIKIDPDHLEFVCAAARNTSPTEYVAYEFVVRDKGYKPKNAEPQKCSELVWVPLDDLPEDIVEHFRHVIENSINGSSRFLELSY